MLEIHSLGIQFGGLRALHALDLRVGEREIVGMIGPNGAGKTTVFNLITGIYRPTEGDVRLEGRSLRGLKPHQVTRRGVGRTFQNIRLFRNLTVLENVLIAHHPRAPYHLSGAVLRLPGFFGGEEAMRRDTMELLAMMQLADRAGEHAGNLPYGDQRRLEIARAMASGPRLLLLDEPAAGMNDREGQDLMALIRFIRDRFGLSILLIEHDMKVVMGVCERVCVLDHGIPVTTGTPEEVQNDPAVIEAYLGKRDEKIQFRDRGKPPGGPPEARA